jgi:hypothetical protein
MRFVHVSKRYNTAPLGFVRADIWMFAFGMPNIRYEPNLKIVQPKSSPWNNCAGNGHCGPPETTIRKIEAETLSFLIIDMRKTAAISELFEIGFAHPHFWRGSDQIVKFDGIAPGELAWTDTSFPIDPVSS